MSSNTAISTKSTARTESSTQDQSSKDSRRAILIQRPADLNKVSHPVISIQRPTAALRQKDASEGPIINDQAAVASAAPIPVEEQAAVASPVPDVKKNDDHNAIKTQHRAGAKRPQNRESPSRANSAQSAINLVVQQAPQPVPEKPRPKEPCIDNMPPSEIYRALEQILPDTLTLYVIQPFSLAGIKFPHLVSPRPWYQWIPVYYGYHYSVEPVVVAGKRQPHIHVDRAEYRFGSVVSTTTAFLEWQLVLKCFNQTTIRDYDTLVDSVFMIVNRSLGNAPRATFDIRLKLDALASLYLHIHPPTAQITQMFTRALTYYRPRIPGVYALGSTECPDQGQPEVKIEFLEARSYAKAHYVARLLVPELKGIVSPLHVPARCASEYIKGFAKRLKRPPPSTGFYINKDNVRVEFSYDQVLEEFRNTALFLVQRDRERWSSIPFMTPDEILLACVDKAHDRFKSQREREAYVQGAQIALGEGLRSENFQRLCDLCVSVKVFDKGEGYTDFKPIRYIMAPKVIARGFCHALLMNTQHRLFGSGDYRHPNTVKYLSEDARVALVPQLFGSSEVCNGDISSMESTITAHVMDTIERTIILALCAPEERDKLSHLWDVYTRREYVAYNKEFRLTFEPIRLSGCEHTSAGNFMVNLVWIYTMIHMITGSYPSRDFRLLVEGDDSLYTREVPLENGETYRLDAKQFESAAACIRTRQKLEIYNTYNDAKFCGIWCSPARVEDSDGEVYIDDVLNYETEFVLSRVLWDVNFDRTTAKFDPMKVYARCLAYLPRVRGNREAYECLYWLAQKTQPQGHQLSNTGRWATMVYETWFRGSMSDMPDLTDWTLPSYCQKFDLPIVVPKLDPIYRRPPPLCHPDSNAYLMSVVELKDIPKNTEPNALLQLFKSISCRYDVESHDMWEEVEDREDRNCLLNSVHAVLTATHQTDESYENFLARFPAEIIGRGARMDQVLEHLRPGEHFVVQEDNGDRVEYGRGRDEDSYQRVVEEECKAFVRVGTYYRSNGEISGGHAVALVRRDVQNVPVVYTGSGTFASFIFVGLALIAFVCFFIRSTLGSTIYGIPLVAALRVVAGFVGYLGWSIPPIPWFGISLFFNMGSVIQWIVIISLLGASLSLQASRGAIGRILWWPFGTLIYPTIKWLADRIYLLGRRNETLGTIIGGLLLALVGGIFLYFYWLFL